MKRILILLAMLVVGTPVSVSACAYGSFGSSEQFKSSDKTQYRLLCDYQLCSLSIADDGAWGAGSGFNETVAAKCSLESCRANSDYPETCQVVDLNQESDFIKKFHTPSEVAQTQSIRTETDTLTEAGTISVELEFWQSVKDSDNPDMLRAYLEHYPNGKFKSLAQIKLKQLTGSEEADATVSIDEPVKQTIDLSGYWKVEHTIGSSAGAVEPYTLIVQLAQDGNSVSSVTVVELQTAESIPCNDNGGPLDVNGITNGDVFTGTIRSANLDSRFSLTGDHKKLKGTYNSRWLSGICGGEMSGSVTARKLSDDTIRQLTSSIETNAVSGSNQLASKTIGSKAGMSGVEKECFEAFHRQDGRWWLYNIVHGDNDSAFDPIPCLPFVSKDMKTWIGSNPDTGEEFSSESVSNNNDTQDSVQPSSTASTVAISRRQWCVTSSGVSNRPYAECLKKNGIPTRGQTGAIVDRASSYFREWKKNKAFAISTDNIGDSGSWKSGGDAIKRSLLNCYIYSSVPNSCRVVNVNGRYEEHFDEQRARDAAFGANGPLDGLVGTYYFEMNYQGIDGTLRVKMSGGSISAKLETCIEGLCTDWTLNSNPYTRGGRRLTGTMKRGPKGQTWTAREIFFRASFSKDTKRIIGNLGFYEFEGKKRSSN